MRGGGRQGRSPGFNAYVGFRQRWREKQRDKSFKKKNQVMERKYNCYQKACLP